MFLKLRWFFWKFFYKRRFRDFRNLVDSQKSLESHPRSSFKL